MVGAPGKFVWMHESKDWNSLNQVHLRIFGFEKEMPNTQYYFPKTENATNVLIQEC